MPCSSSEQTRPSRGCRLSFPADYTAHRKISEPGPVGPAPMATACSGTKRGRRRDTLHWLTWDSAKPLVYNKGPKIAYNARYAAHLGSIAHRCDVREDQNVEKCRRVSVRTDRTVRQVPRHGFACFLACPVSWTCGRQQPGQPRKQQQWWRPVK